jgi:UDP-N-acetylmuramoylalanine--D-glutamate ligase
MIETAARESGARVVTFGLERGDYRIERNMVMSPDGPIMPVGSLWRSMPHDVTNSLAAAAVALESGICSLGQVAPALEKFESASHRIELVGKFKGSDWFDDSKATSPHAALTAIRAFDRLVLIAGGRNKDLDLSQMASEPTRMRGVVAIGDDAHTIADAFHAVCPVRIASNMKEAVSLAASLSEPGVAVLLSPGCTSYDWYSNYNERGDHFQSEVRSYFANDSEKH